VSRAAGTATPAGGCPCGRPLAYAACCGRFIEGGEAAPDAESLMRSRYTAFTRGAEAYLLATWHPSTRPARAIEEGGVKWLGLTVQGHRALDADHAEVRFVARFRAGGGPAGRIEECSRFVREGGRWYYLAAAPGDAGA